MSFIYSYDDLQFREQQNGTGGPERGLCPRLPGFIHQLLSKANVPGATPRTLLASGTVSPLHLPPLLDDSHQSANTL